MAISPCWAKDKKPKEMHKGAIVLCGGKSSRMGRDKATLPFGPELMLQRVVRLISQVVDPMAVVVVAAIEQQLPHLPANVIITRDELPGRGPLEGIAAGLRAMPGYVEAVYATSCDVPLLVPEFVLQMFERLDQNEIAVPFDGQYHHPLAAVYRPRVLSLIHSLLEADRLRPRFLFDQVATAEIPVETLRAVDPKLSTLMNLNHPEDYHDALKMAGLDV
jgi:molybdopterin-guanine dinucleotide biosynthesis protein A